MAGSPPGARPAASPSGILHIAAGGVGFLAFAVVMLVLAGWSSGRGAAGDALPSRTSGVIVLPGFVGGAVLPALPLGVASLWIAVVAGWTWPTGGAARPPLGCRTPDTHRRTQCDTPSP